jgi:hypothetical protein
MSGTVNEFTVPDSTRIYMTSHYMDLRDPTLHEFMRPDFTRIYAT